MITSALSGLTSGNLSLSSLLEYPSVGLSICSLYKDVSLVRCKGTNPSCHKERDSITKIGTQVSALKAFLCDSVKFFRRSIRHIELLAKLLFVLLDKCISGSRFSRDTNYGILCSFWVFEDCGDIPSDVVTGSDPNEFLAGSGNRSLSLFKVDATNRVGQVVVEKETSCDQGIGDLAGSRQIFEIARGVTLSLENQFARTIY